MPLDPQAVELLRIAENSGRPLLESLSAPEARAQYAEMVAPVAGEPLPGIESRDTEVPGPAGRIPVRIYRPEGAKGALPVLVFYHGGGYVIGNRDTHDAPCRYLCREGACLVVSVDYRLAPEHPFPAAVDDAWAALRWVAAHAAALGGDPARIAVGGDSAGGNLSAVVALLAKKEGGPKLVRQLLIYPGTDLTCAMPSHEELADGYRLTRDLIAWFMNHYFAEDVDRGQWMASPLFAEDLSGLPPAVVVVAGYDPLKDEDYAYAGKLKAAGVPVQILDYPGMIHGFISMPGFFDAARDCLTACGRALRAAFAAE